MSDLTSNALRAVVPALLVALSSNCSRQGRTIAPPPAVELPAPPQFAPEEPQPATSPPRYATPDLGVQFTRTDNLLSGLSAASWVFVTPRMSLASDQLDHPAGQLVRVVSYKTVFTVGSTWVGDTAGVDIVDCDGNAELRRGGGPMDLDLSPEFVPGSGKASVKFDLRILPAGAGTWGAVATSNDVILSVVAQD